MDRTPLPAPVTAGGHVILEPDAPVVWFTFAGAWHDIGRFHTAAGAFTGCYANILTPVRFRSPLEWETTDLFLDVWLARDGSTLLLDQDEFDDAVARGWVPPEFEQKARTEAARLLRAAAAGEWPPPIVEEWPLPRALAAAASDGTRSDEAV